MESVGSNEVAISSRNLNVTFGETIALRDITVDIPAGSITGLLGPNGSGKSTFMRCLFAHITPDSGTVTVAGKSAGERDSLFGVVGAIADSVGLDPKLTARRILRAMVRDAGVSTSRVDEVLREVSAEGFADQKIEDLSTGMRQRIALAVALVGDPRILVLDEPQNGLDPEGVAWLRDRLMRFAARGGTVLISSHLLAELASFVDHIVVLRTGLVFQGSISSLEGTDLETHFFELMNATNEMELELT